MKILVVSSQQTHPITAGNVNWINTQCRLLQYLGHEVYFLCVNQPDFHPVVKEWIDCTKKYWGDHFFSYSMTRFDRYVIRLKDKIRGQKKGKFFWGCDDKYPLGLSRFVEKLHGEYNFDACIVQYFFFTKLFEHVSFNKMAVSTHDCFSYRNTRVNDNNSIAISVADEAKCLQRCNYVFALQEEERTFFQRIAPWSNVLNVYNYYEYKPSDIVGNKNILFLSSGNPYNINGAVWFIEKVFPLIQNIHPDARLLVGGMICKSLTRYKDISGIELLGFVENAIEFYAKGDIAINPICEGTGLKIKTFESVQYDKVTLVRPHSIVGIFSPDNHSLYVSENPRDWADYISNVWSSKDLIFKVKAKNRDYLDRMNNYIINQYNIFAK